MEDSRRGLQAAIKFVLGFDNDAEKEDEFVAINMRKILRVWCWMWLAVLAVVVAMLVLLGATGGVGHGW